MRWLKHMTGTRQDEKVAELISKGGHEAYAIWWMVLETIADGMDKSSEKCSLKYPISKWAAELQLLPQNVCRQVAVMGAVGLLSINRDGAMLELSAPKLLKYRDEYSRKSGHNQESVGSKKQSTDTDTDTDNTPAPLGAGRIRKPSRKKNRTTEEISRVLGDRLLWFTEFWKEYPRKDAMNPTMDAYERAVADHDKAVLLWKGAKVYAARAKADPGMLLAMGATWIHQERWLDENVIPARKLTATERAIEMARLEDAKNGIPYESE